MKKSVLSLLIGSAMLIAPMTASALTPMTADSLKDATGQAGVSIAIDGVKLESFVGATRYIDDDGYTTLTETVNVDLGAAKAFMDAQTPAIPNTITVDGSISNDASTAIVISDKHKVQYINAIIGGNDTSANNTFKGATSANARALTGMSHTYVNTMGEARTAIAEDLTTTPPVEAVDAVPAGENVFETRALTIDAGTCRLLTKGLAANVALSATATGADLAAYAVISDNSGYAHAQVAGVVIGLPTIEIVTSADTYSIGIEQSGALNDGKNFITISKSSSSLAVLGGVLEIAPH